jgi:hypothetical protein
VEIFCKLPTFSYTGTGWGPAACCSDEELGCPLPRLTLLFFGAAKDVPEAAKMVTAGTACLHLESKPTAKQGTAFKPRDGP